MRSPADFARECHRIRSSRKRMAACWAAGQLWWLLDWNQYRAYVRIRAQMAKPFGRFTLKWARRTGKTFLLELIVIEECIRHTGHRYNVAAATDIALVEFVWPAVLAILSTCPPELRSRIRQVGNGHLWFCKKAHRGRCDPDQNHSWVVLAGCNNARDVERLRGPFSHGNVMEEIGAMPDAPGLRYIQTSILKPQTITTGGWTIRAGTPPKSVGHEAAAAFQQAEAEPETYSYATLYDNPRLTPEVVQQYLESDARDLGMSVEEYKRSPDYRREWLAIVETDPTLAVLPPCTPERMWGPSMKPPAQWREGADPRPWMWRGDGPPPLVRVLEDTPMFRDRYESMDLGFFPHFTHILFGYWHYERRVLVIEDELQMRRLNDTRLAHLIGGRVDKASGVRVPLEGEDRALAGPWGMERKVWGPNAVPYMRVADNNAPLTLSELAIEHGLIFVPTRKDELEAQIVHVCRWAREGKLAIHPRVVHLIAQMQAAVWNKARTEFAESKEFGHFDAVAALIYLVRNVIPNQDRVPEGYGLREDSWVVGAVDRGDEEVLTGDAAVLAEAFSENDL